MNDPLSVPVPAGEVSALILGAGSGERIGGRPKAFLQRGETTLLEHTVALMTPFASEIIVGLPPDVALALSLMKRIREFLVGVPGLLVWQTSELHRHFQRAVGASGL